MYITDAMTRRTKGCIGKQPSGDEKMNKAQDKTAPKDEAIRFYLTRLAGRAKHKKWNWLCAMAVLPV